MTSLSRELGREISVEEAATEASRVLTAVYPQLIPSPATNQRNP
jgi:hypothetical protein